MGQGFKLRNGSLLVVAEAPGGIYNSGQLQAISEAGLNETAIVKVTEDQRIALFVAEADLEGLTQKLSSVGLGVRPYLSGMHQPTACLGELCPDHQQDALDAAIQVSQALDERSLDQPFKIGINGCATCCVPCHTLDISAIGDESGYRLSIGGKNSQIPEFATFVADAVPAAELPNLVGRIVDTYSQLTEGDESLQDVMDRCGSSAFIEALHPYSQDASGDSDPFGMPEEEPSDGPAVEQSAGDEESQEEVAADSGPGELCPSDHLTAGQTHTDHDINPQEFTPDANDVPEPDLQMEQVDGPVPDEDEDDLEVDTAVPDDNHDAADIQELDSDDLELAASPEPEIDSELDEVLPSEAPEVDSGDLPVADESLIEEEGESQSPLPEESQELDVDHEELEESQELDVDHEEDGGFVADADVVEEAEDLELDESMDVDEDELEEQIAQDIDEVEDLGTDENKTERDSVIQMVDASSDVEDGVIDNDLEDYDLETDDDDDEPMYETDNLDQPIRLADEEQEEEHPMTQLANSGVQATPTAAGSGWAIQSFDLKDNGGVLVTFTNGAEIEIPSDGLESGAKTYTVGGQTITVEFLADVLQVSADGLRLKFPRVTRQAS